jgi:hypothetical protein
MTLDAFITLESLHCLREVDLPRFGGSEPYLWPVLIRIDDLTIQTPGLVAVIAPAVGNARVIIRDSMRAGQTADIPLSVGLLRTRLEDNLFDTRLLLVVALWDGDETPGGAVRAGYQAFVSELGAAIGDGPTLLALKDAEDRQDEAAKAAIIKAIREQVEKRVKSAISGALSTTDKIAVKTGFLNLDDAIGSTFKGFANALPTPLILRITQGGFNDFEIRGRLEIREVRRDRCQSQVNAVSAAQAEVNGVNSQIKALQAELQHASPAEKPFLISEITRLREEDLADALAVLDAALRALSVCRSRLPPTFPLEAEQVPAAAPIT